MTPKNLKLLLALVVACNVAIWFLVVWHWNDLDTMGRVARQNADEAAINQALAKYLQTNGRLPSTEEGLEALVHQPSGAGSTWQPLFAYVPKDFWGHPYHYRLSSDRPAGYDVFSLGPDGRENTKDDVHLK